MASETLVRAELEANRGKAEKAAKETVIELYVRPNTGLLNWILQAKSLQEVIERIDSARMLAGAQRRAITRYADEVRASQTRTEEFKAAQVAAAKDQQDADTAGQMALIAFTDAQMKEAAASTGARLVGKFVFPIAGTATFRNDWGDPRSGGRRHKGTDVFAEYGLPLVACEDGTLTSIGLDDLGGLGFFLVGESGIHYYYAHLSALAPGAFEGEAVKAGDLVGYVGDSGNAQGGAAHLHFQVHPDGGEPVNPFPLLDAAHTLRPAPSVPSTLPRQGSQATSEFVTTRSTSTTSDDRQRTGYDADTDSSGPDSLGTVETTSVSTLRTAVD